VAGLAVVQRVADRPGSATLLRQVFGVGTVRGRSDGDFYFEVTRANHLEARVFPFFDRFPIRGPKAKDLSVFRVITELVRSGRNLVPAWIEEIPRSEGSDEPRRQAPAER
jgi:hypothetical protein